MELDELKHQLKQKLATDHAGRSDADIAALLQKRTGSVIDKIKKNLLIEIISCIFIFILFVLIGLNSHYRSFQVYFSFFAVVLVVLLLPVIYLLKKITRLTSSSLPVKGNLQIIVTIVESFIKRYFQFTMLLLPVTFIFAFLLGHHYNEKITEFSFAKKLFGSRSQVIYFVIIYLAAFSVVIYYFTKWYLRKLYGNYVNQLKECIRDLSEEE